MSEKLISAEHQKPKASILAKVQEFIKTFESHETRNGINLLLYFDEKSGAYYTLCHLDGNTLASKSDFEASLDADEDDEIYKLNRDITEDKAAYDLMKEHALQGRSFEDMVLEYDTSYRKDRPLKIYGGQHRIKAITEAVKAKGNTIHGVRVYFDLSREQKVEIAFINNTSITVPNDLLDRMQEQLIGTELRNWCQTVGLLEKGEDFADKKDPNSPTVRVARTLIVNFYKGIAAKEDDFHDPVVCKSGGMDLEYKNIRSKVNWEDQSLITMGKEFARLHKLQKERVNEREQDNIAEFARKALSLTLVASWSYASGLFQNKPETLASHYSLPDSVSGTEDPLNAKALSQARLKGTDPDTYRGLGTRISTKELGRMLEVFLVLATKAAKKRITKELANAAIQSYEAKKATFDAHKKLERI